MDSDEIEVRLLGEKGWFEGLKLFPKDAVYGRHHLERPSDPNGDRWLIRSLWSSSVQSRL